MIRMRNMFRNINQRVRTSMSVGQAILFNIICVIFYQFICEVHFDSATDQFLNNVFAGSFGENGSGYGVIHVVTGFCIKTLYSLVPQLPWYVLLQYICIFVSFFVIVYIILENNSKWGAYITSTLFLLLIGYECYARVSYIKIGVLCVAAACFILYQMASGRKRHKIYAIMSVLLFLCGYLWWGKAVLIAGSIMLLPCVYKIFEQRKNDEWKGRKTLIISILVLMVGTVFLEVLDYAYINKNPQIKEYVDYNSTWQDINNHGWPEYSDYQTEYEKMGISENTYLLLTQGDTVGEYVVSLEELQRIKTMVEPSGISFSRILEFTRTYPLHYFDIGLFMGFLIFFYLFCISKTCGKKRFSIYIWAVTLLIYFLFFLNGVDKNMVISTSIWIAAVVFITGTMEGLAVEQSELRKYYSFAASIVVLIMINKQYSDITSVIDVKPAESMKEVKALINDHTMNTYVTNNSEFYALDKPFDKLEKGSFHNYLSADNWHKIYNSQNIGERIMEDYGRFRFLSQEYADGVAEFLNERYSMECVVVMVGQINEVPIFMLRTEGVYVDTASVNQGNFSIISDVSIGTEQNENGRKEIEGYIYKENTDSFAQKVYVEVHDTMTDSYFYFDTIQGKKMDSKEIMNGAYSAIYAEVDDWERAEYSVVLEVGGHLYRMPVRETFIEAADG